VEMHNQESSGLGEGRNTPCFLSRYVLFTHAFCICFYSIMLFITLFFILRMKYEHEGGCGENKECVLKGLGADE